MVDADFLADTVDGRPRAEFQAVALPNDNPFPAGSAERAAPAGPFGYLDGTVPFEDNSPTVGESCACLSTVAAWTG